MKRFSLVVLAAALAAAATTPAPAVAAELRSQGPSLMIGVSAEDEGDLVHTGLGWRWELEPGERTQAIANRIGTRLSWAIEPQAAVISNDRDAFEVQVVPMFEITGAGVAENGYVPALEGGIGLIYIEVTGFDLGSQILFSDNLGFRLDMPTLDSGARWSLAYRFRHISHAGIWANANSGMNTHWFGVTYQMPPPASAASRE
jgi:hypothetical protein